MRGRQISGPAVVHHGLKGLRASLVNHLAGLYLLQGDGVVLGQGIPGVDQGQIPHIGITGSLPVGEGPGGGDMWDRFGKLIGTGKNAGVGIAAQQKKGRTAKGEQQYQGAQCPAAGSAAFWNP